MARSSSRYNHSQNHNIMDQHHGSSGRSIGSQDSSYGDPPPPPPPPRKSRDRINASPRNSSGPEYIQSRSTGTTVTRDRARNRNVDENGFDDDSYSRPTRRSHGRSSNSYGHDASSIMSGDSNSSFTHQSGAPPPPPPPGQPPIGHHRQSKRGWASSSSRDSRGSTPVAGHSISRRNREDLGKKLENNEGSSDYERMDDHSTANDSRSFFDEPQDRRGRGRDSRARKHGSDDRSTASSALSNLIDESRRKHEWMKQDQGDASYKSRITGDDASLESRRDLGRSNDLASQSGDTEVLQFGNMPSSQSRDSHSVGEKESVAARRRRKAQAAASGAKTAAVKNPPPPPPKLQPVEARKKEEGRRDDSRTGTDGDHIVDTDGAKSDDDPPLELYSESDSDDSYVEDDAAMKKKKKKKGLGFFKVKNLIRMGGNKTPERKKNRSVSPVKRSGSNLSTDSRKRGILSRISPAKSRDVSPQQRVGRRGSEREGRSRRSPSPFGFRNRSRSRSRSVARGEDRDSKQSSNNRVKNISSNNQEKEKNKSKLRSKEAKNEVKTKRSSEIVVSKDKLAENERKLNESAIRDRAEMEEKTRKKQQDMDDASRGGNHKEIIHDDEKSHFSSKSFGESSIEKLQKERELKAREEKERARREHEAREAEKLRMEEKELARRESERKEAERLRIAEEEDRIRREQEEAAEARRVENEKNLAVEKDSFQNSMISAEDSDEVSEMTDPTYETRSSAKRKSPVHMEAISELSPRERKDDDESQSDDSNRSPGSRSLASKSSRGLSTNSRSKSPTSRSSYRMDSKVSSSVRSKSPENSHQSSFQSSTTSGSKNANNEDSWNPETFTGKENFITMIDDDHVKEARSSTDPFDDPFYPITEEDQSKEDLSVASENDFEISQNINGPNRQESTTNLSFDSEVDDRKDDGDVLSYATPANSDSTEIHNNVSPPPPPRRVTERKPRLPHQSSSVPKIDARNGFLGIDEASGEVTLNVGPKPESVSKQRPNPERTEGSVGSFSQRALRSRSPRSHIPGVILQSSPNNARGFLENDKESIDDTNLKKQNSRILREKQDDDEDISLLRGGTSRQKESSISPQRSHPNEGRNLEKSLYPSRSNSISPDRSLYSTRSQQLSPDRKGVTGSPGSRRMIHSPSFILDRREKRKQREADLEKKARNIRSQVKALERRRSDFYSIAQERGRRREVVFKSSEGISAHSPAPPRTYSPEKLKRALVDERNNSPLRALVESPSRSPVPIGMRRTRSPNRVEDSWFEKPDFNTRAVRAASRERARNNKKKMFRAPAVFSGSTRGIQFEAPEAYSRRTDPVLASVAHIKDPIQRAGAMILTAAAIPIQAEIRRYLAVKEREDRTWAIIVVQAYFRRWKAELARYKYLYCATRIQAAFRGWLVRDTMEDKHYCATQIQKIARGYLATMKVYEDLYNITVVQSIARRNLAIKQAERRYSDIITVQSVARGYICRKEMELLHSSATKIQTNWRTYTCQMNYQFDVVDIIIVQSITRKRAAQKLAEIMRQERDRDAAITIQKYWRSYDCTMNYLHAVADILIVQSVVRRWISKRFVSQYRKDLHFKMSLRIQMLVRSWLAKTRTSEERAARDIQKIWRGYSSYTNYKKERAATDIQKTWRGFWCYTDYVFTLADIIVVQRTVRSHLACKKVDVMRIVRQEKTENDAAVSIQKYWRGYAAQMNMLFSLVHIIIVQSVVRRRIAMIKFKPRVQEHRAAIKIQQFWLTFLRKRNFMYNYCATIIQARARVFLAENLAEQMYCARKIQSWYRCQATRRGYLYYVSARKIQRLWRGYDARKLADEERWVREYAATTIQKTWRMFYQHSSYCIYIHESRAATNIQKHWRGFWDYSHYVIMRYEVCKIQAIYRGYVHRKTLEKQNAAAIVIQSSARTLLAKKTVHMERLFATMVYAAQQALSQKIAARKIQFAFRSHYQRIREKRAALIIERFFIWVRAEVEREIERREKQRILKRQKQRSRKKKEEDSLLENVYNSVENTPSRGGKVKPGNRLKENLKDSLHSSSRQRSRPHVAVDLDDAGSDVSALTTPTASSPRFKIRSRGNHADVDDELEGAWLEAERKRSLAAYNRGPRSRPKTRESQKENSSAYTPNLKLSSRSLSRTREEMRRAQVS